MLFFLYYLEQKIGCSGVEISSLERNVVYVHSGLTFSSVWLLKSKTLIFFLAYLMSLLMIPIYSHILTAGYLLASSWFQYSASARFGQLQNKSQTRFAPMWHCVYNLHRAFMSTHDLLYDQKS